MKTLFKMSIVGFFILVNLFGLMCLDFVVHDWKYFRSFNFGLLVNSFFYDYLKSESFLSESKCNLYLGECTHLQSIEGVCYEGQELVINDGYNFAAEDYWFIDRMEECKIPKVVALNLSYYHPSNHGISLTLRNYTLHQPTFLFEKMEQNGWKRKDVTFQLVDSLTNTGANKLSFLFRENQEERQLSCEGTIRIYEIDTKGFELGEYRVIVHLEGHNALVENIEIVPNLPVEWTIDGSDCINEKSVEINIKNKSNYTIYYPTWDLPNRPRLRPDLTIYRNGEQTKKPFGGFGCGTGVYLQALAANESIVCKDSSPLLWGMDIESDSFPTQLNRIYGDSVGVTYQLFTVLPIWANYETQYIRSEEFIIRTADLLESWEKTHKIKESIASDRQK